MPGARVLSQLLLSLCLLLAAGAAGAAPQPVAMQGELRLATVPRDVLPLQGEWGFAWQEFIDPQWQTLPTTAFAPVPSSWNDIGADGKPPGQDGWGSYALLVDCPRGAALAVEALGQRTASRLFVNGERVAQHGEPGDSAQSTWAAVHHRVPITREFACPLRLTLHVSNFDHRAGGFVRPIVLGTAEALARERETDVLLGAALLTAYLLIGAVALIFYAVRRRERVPLVFGLFCVAMAVYTDMIGARLLLRPLPPQVSWVAYMQAEYLSWVAAMALFLLTLRGLFPVEIHRRVVQVLLTALGVAALSVIVLPPGVYSHLVTPGSAIAVGVGVGAYIIVAMVRARKRTPVDAGILQAGMAAILLALALDLLLIDAPRPDRKFTPVGFAFFLLSPALVIARRLSHALNAEERALTLEENARLREDVERISRHDLKTPLNSILGATRLLRDDNRLSTEQRELVGVQQRAAMRMLEMVNLSLGLFRMETGSYEFKPQAVDLREVVTRVLVDLHSLAEASEVTLHLQGSGGRAVYVRAEELLCYSIVANLVKNAVEACGPGGKVTLALRAGDPVELAIHNRGEVPPEVASRFFEKYMTRGKSAGTGLGTYSARLMARAQQGDLSLHTDREDGTTVTLTLRPVQGEVPLRVPASVAADTSLRWLQGLPQRTVLLVDDDEYTRLVNRRMLPNPPFEVETAANGQAATEAMMKRWPHYLLVDMEMPVKNGIETVHWVRAYEEAHDLPRCRIVMVSGNDDEAAAAQARQAGVDRFLLKPVSREQLVTTLRELELGMPPPEPEPTPTPQPTPAPVPEEAAGEKVLRVDPEWMAVFPGFLRQQRETVEAMARALTAGDREEVQFLAHRAFGGLSSMGLEWASRQSRTIEKEALQGASQELERRIGHLREHLRKVRIEPQ